MIILPRQARDKHIGKTQKEMPFTTGDGDTVGLLIDLSTKTLSVYKNGDCVAALIHTGLTGPVCFMAELCMGKETRLLRCHLILQLASFCQDRLRTNIGFNIEQKDVFAGPHHPQTQEAGQAYPDGTVRINWAAAPPRDEASDVLVADR